MLHAELADASYLFIGSTHIAVENAESSELAREWQRRQLSEAAARLSPPARQFVDLSPPQVYDKPGVCGK